MKPIKGFENFQSYSDTKKLPAGGYVCRILDAKEAESDWGNRLEIAFDISEGEYAGYYKANFASQKKDGTEKWKGVLRLTVPEDESSQYFDGQCKALKTAIEAIEESNPGYAWDWNEKGLKGKEVGAIFRDQEWSFNGRTGMTAQCYGFRDVEKVREGDFRVPEPKYLNPQNAADDVDLSAYQDMPDDNLPF